MELTTKRYQSISYISGPLLFVEGAKDLAYGAIFGALLDGHMVIGNARGARLRSEVGMI